MTQQGERRDRGGGLRGFAWLLALSIALLALASWLEGSAAWRHPLRWLETLDQSAALAVLIAAAQVVAGMLAILITVVAIVVQLAATRYTHRVTTLFVRDRVNQAVMTLFVLTTALCIWLALVLTGEVHDAPIVPRGGFLLAMGLMTACVIALVPYFGYVFRFVSPLSVIRRIRAAALNEVQDAVTGDPHAAELAVIESIEELEDVARGAMNSYDRAIAMSAIEALATLLTDVERLRGALPEEWFRVDDAIARDPDFVSMSQTALEEVARTRSWFESKILRQYHALFIDAVNSARDVAGMIAIHTRRLAELCGAERPELVVLCQRAFNSYLRASINGSDVRTAYYVLHQYRMLGETLLARGDEPAALEVASRIRFYGRLAKASGLPFLLEVAAYDVAQLVELAVANVTARDALLDILLGIDQPGAQSLPGVRRAQVQLATFFLARGDTATAQRIVGDLAGERRELLASVRADIEREVSPHYSEIENRGANFSYLAPERRAQLDALYAMLGAAA
ncbi:MAG: DUF2254 domain-containing protein [Betaproteobacteria bacterium]|jgi:hypothetical protein|nr:DUF2254 domain-containing protein [Betaproteobacteria bacterium]